MRTLTQESDTVLVWPSIGTAIRYAVSDLVGYTAAPSLLSRLTVRPVIRTLVPVVNHRG